MSEIRCADLLAWLRSAAHARRLTPTPTPALAAHAATCPTCQAALLLLARELAAPSLPATISCQQCRDDLPGYLEHDLPAEAIGEYPQVWWHVSTCADCAETARLTRALIEAERSGALVPPRPRPAMRRHTLVKLSPRLLARALPPAAPMRGADQTPAQVLSQRAVPAGHNFTLSVERLADNTWSLRVEFRPPLAGWLVLTLGEAKFRAPVDEHGVATLGGLPAELLAEAGGPELLVELEQHAAS